MNPIQYYAKADRQMFIELRRRLQKENRMRSVKLEEIPVPQDDIRGNPPKRAWVSRTHLVQLFDDSGTDRLSINRADIDNYGMWLDGITWDDLQRIKAEIGFGDRWAVEIFPPDNKVINVANIRHLWLLPTEPDFGWKGGQHE
jgi:hypothetical protein